MSFVHEVEVYNLLTRFKILVPPFSFLEKESDYCHFKEGTPVVFKRIAKELWHKSDLGGVLFENYSEKLSAKIHHTFSQTKDEYSPIGTLVCQRVQITKVDGLPTEMFVSISRDPALGTLVTMGIGGIHTEKMAKEIPSSLLLFPLVTTSKEEAYHRFSKSFLGAVYLGTLRQGKPLVDSSSLFQFISSLWDLALYFSTSDLELLEINPFVVSNGEIVALDGVGKKGVKVNEFSKKVSESSLLNPKSIAVVGASTKDDSVGTMILKNLLTSNLKERIRVIRPGGGELHGVRCEESIKLLRSNPVDVLILSLPAKNSVELIEELIFQGGGAEIIYLVAGGIGDGADQSGYGKRVLELLNEKREEGGWTPYLIGPNGLGMILSPQKINSLFIPPEKLPVHFDPNSKRAIVSQSGAFLITRISKMPHLPFKYAYSIGNQIDLSLSDFFKAITTDLSIDLIALYIEGFSYGDGAKLAILIKSFVQKGGRVILLKGGQSEKGQSAAAGHTGAMASSYNVVLQMLLDAGATVAPDLLHFNSLLEWSPKKQVKDETHVAIVSNAGFESVASADLVLSKSGRDLLVPLTDSLKERLTVMIEKNRLVGIVSPGSPLDLTPMADERAYLDSLQVFLEEKSVLFVLLGIVPLTKRLDTFNSDKVLEFAKKIKELTTNSNKETGVIIDSGPLYEEYRSAFKQVGIPTFDSIDVAMRGVQIFYK